MDYSKGNSQDKNPTITQTQREDWFTPRLRSHPGAHREEGHLGEGRLGEGHRGEGHRGEGHRGEGHRGEGYRGEGRPGEGHPGDGHPGERHRGDCRHLPICSVAAGPHRHPRCFWLPQLLAELAPLGKVFAASQDPKTPAL